MMPMRSQLTDYILQGQEGLNKALPIGIDDPTDALIGILPSHYYLVGADSGIGKTTFADYNYLLTPYFENKDSEFDVDWFYYSLELGASMKMMSWLNYVIYKEEKKIIPLTDIAGFKGTKLTTEQLDLIEKYIPTIEALKNDINFSDDTINPTGIRAELMDYAKKNGEFIYEKYQIDGKTHQKIVDYIPNNPKKRTIIIVDHIALLGVESGKSTKQLMDLLSEYAVWFRNKCGFTFVMVQQFSTNLENNSRSQNRNDLRIIPTRSDFGDSTYTYRDADIVVGGVCPAKFEIASYRGFDINEYGESLTFWYVIKNRWIGKLREYPLERQRDLPMFKSLTR